MRKQENREIPTNIRRLTVNTETLAAMLDCGRDTAAKIGTAAGARIKIGTRVLFNVSEVERYINERTGSRQEGA